MKKTCKKYNRAFKERVIELSEKRKNLSDFARELGRYPSQLYKWRKEVKEFGRGSFPGNGNWILFTKPLLFTISVASN